MSGEVPKVDQAKCAHARVYYSKHEDHGVVHSEHWYCTECHLEFYPMTWGFEPGKITVVDPVVTLRDQFAMAALAALISRGASPDVQERGYNAFEWATRGSYQYAEAMMEARKT